MLVRGTHPLEPLVLDQVDPRARGQAHGEHWRADIRALAQQVPRWMLAGRGFDAESDVLDVAQACLATLARAMPALAEELRGIAQGAGLALSRVVAINLLGDLTREGAPLTGGTLVYFCGERGPLLGSTWDLPVGAEPYVRTLRIAPNAADDEILCLTLAGCVGGMGLSGLGVAVATTSLATLDVGVGLSGVAVVRDLLAQPHARAAHERLCSTRLAGGRVFLLADGHDYYGVEHGGQRAVLTQLGPRAAHLHTNHYFDPVLRGRERMVALSTSHARLGLATTLYAQHRPRDADAMWSLLHARDGSSRSLSIDPVPNALPGAPSDRLVTGATMVMRLHDGWVRVVSGAEHRNPPLTLRVGRWRGPSPPI